MSLTNADITDRVKGVVDALDADGYQLTVDGPSDGRLTARVVAGPDACPDCLVPKQVMSGLLAQAIGDPQFAAERIDVVYPS